MQLVRANRSAKRLCHLAALITAIGLGGEDALAQTTGRDDPKVRELMRKAEAKETTGDFCLNTRWPAGDYAGYKDFLEGAKPGAWKINTFKGGENCQHDRVNTVFNKSGIRCVSYTWWSCNLDANCSRGSAVACKNRNGEWETELGQ